jgi:uroporphyrinogen III methyltransferase/synthase
VTSAFAAAAEAEIMLTHKQYSSTIATATGHDPSLLDFQALARTDTVILLMATLTLEAIVDGLVEAGRDPATPVAVLRNATLPSSEAWYGTLADIVAQTDGKKLSPSVLIVGEAARRDAQGRSVL